MGRDFEKLLAERVALKAEAQTAHPVPHAAIPDPPVAHLTSESVAKPGADFTVLARVDAPQALKSIRLRYRHVNQVEDYQEAEMTLEPSTGTFHGKIPGTFITPNWDLMYFVETIGTNGSGRMYPDLEREAPYVIVPTRSAAAQ